VVEPDGRVDELEEGLDGDEDEGDLDLGGGAEDIEEKRVVYMIRW
jgi:hypothetical protein